MFGKQVFAGPGRNIEWTLVSRLCWVSPATLSSCSLHVPLVVALFQEETLCLKFFRKLGGKSKFLPESFGPPLFSAQDNAHAQERFWGTEFCCPTVEAVEQFGKNWYYNTEPSKSWMLFLHLLMISFLSFFFFFGCATRRSLWGLSSLTRDWTQALGSENTES